MNQDLVKRIRECPSLPSLPAVAMRVLELAAQAQVDIAEIAAVISKDPALSGKILRTVNSSFYGRSQSVTTLTHALVILGLSAVKTLVLGFSLVSNLRGAPTRGFNHQAYWRRSVHAATAARIIAARAKLDQQQEECFVIGLLMDIGMLVLDQVAGERYGDVYGGVSTHNDLPGLEESALGMTHADAAAALAEEWKLPPALAVPMARHHAPDDAGEEGLKALARVAMLAGRCADVFVERPGDPLSGAALADVRKLAGEWYGISPADCDAMIAEVGEKAKEMASLFEVNLGPGVEAEQVMRKARDALASIFVQSREAAPEGGAKAGAAEAAPADVDALTGLAVKARFEAFLAEQFAAAVREKKPLAVVLWDVDKLTLINQAKGRSAGDRVLRALGQLVNAAARGRYLGARYGNEELAMVMPGAARATAGATADLVRRAVAARPVACEKGSIAVTASAGVAVYEPGGPFASPAHLVRAAEAALAAAKQGGRNCVKVFAIARRAA